MATGENKLGPPVDHSVIDANILASLTVVILTLNRRPQVHKSVKFWSQFPVAVVVVDGSKSPDEVLISWPNITYVHSQGTYLENHGVAAAYVNSPYVIFASDDELYVPSALVECIEFLEDNRDFVAVCGEAIGLYLDEPNWWWEQQYVRMRGFELTQDSPRDRVLAHLSDYRVLAFCAVTRSEEWVRAWTLISAHEFSPFAASEIQFEAALVCAGKIKVLPVVMWVRNRFIPPLWSDGTGVLGLDPSLTFREWWTSRRFEAERGLFFHTMAEVFGKMLSRSEHYSRRQLRALVRDAFSRFAGDTSDNLGIRRLLRKCFRRINKRMASMLQRIPLEIRWTRGKSTTTPLPQKTERNAVPGWSFDARDFAKLFSEGARVDVTWLNLIGATLVGERPIERG